MAVVQLEPFDADIRKEELVNRFSITNLLDLGNPNPGVDSVKRVYAWIKNEPRCLTGTDKERLYQIRVLAKIRCWTEKHFANYAKVNIHSRHESEQVGAYL
jgi:hypothetical protein